MDESVAAPRASRRSVISVVALAVWITFVFATSCTVVRPFEFFEMARKYVLVDETAFERFKVFWGLSWFVIVKGWHATEFGLLLLFCVGAVKWWCGRIDQATITWSMLFCVLFAISDEWHQSFIPDRLGTVSDVLIDTLGVCVVGFALLKGNRRHAQGGS